VKTDQSGCETDVAGPDRVELTVDVEVGRVAVEMQLPQVRQAEHVGPARRTVHTDAEAHHPRRLVEPHGHGPSGTGPVTVGHGENLPAAPTRAAGAG
jgi:hypothetical protein